MNATTTLGGKDIFFSRYLSKALPNLPSPVLQLPRSSPFFSFCPIHLPRPLAVGPEFPCTLPVPWHRWPGRYCQKPQVPCHKSSVLQATQLWLPRGSTATKLHHMPGHQCPYNQSNSPLSSARPKKNHHGMKCTFTSIHRCVDSRTPPWHQCPLCCQPASQPYPLAPQAPTWQAAALLSSRLARSF